MEILYITDGCLGDTYKVVPPSDGTLVYNPHSNYSNYSNITPIHQP